MPPSDRSSVLSSQSLADAARPASSPSRVRQGDPLRRRISYFMLVRLVVLSLFTVVASVFAWQSDRQFGSLYHGFVWTTLVVGYGLTIVFARLLPRVRDLERFAWIQTSTDIMLAAVVVQVSGGTDSGFTSLYLIAVLGAATMGGVRQTWAAAGACALIYGTTTLLEGLGIIEPTTLGQPVAPLPPVEQAVNAARTLAGLLGVTVLSSFLNKQLASSTIQVGDLRAMNENILRSLASGVIGVDGESRVIYFNPAAERILKLRTQDLKRPLDQVLPGVSPLLQPRSSTEDGSEMVPPRFELEIATRAGGQLHLGLSCSWLRDGQGRRIGQLVQFQDLTRVHELAEQVRRSERLAAVGSLAASVAHEIRNPLAAISGSVELLGIEPQDDDDVRLLAIIRRESSRLSDLVTDMLAFTRPRPPQRVRISLCAIAKDAMENFRADPANEAIETSLHAEDAPDVEVDPGQLSQVLWNLLRNAAEAMEGRGRIEIRVGPRSIASEVELAVVDQGPGIPAEQLDRIFDPFFTTKERGTGFGLATVHRIVQDNGGAIELSSAEGAGTTFRLRFAAVE